MSTDKMKDYHKDSFPGITVPGCGQWTEDEWQALAKAIGATLIPIAEDPLLRDRTDLPESWK